MTLSKTVGIVAAGIAGLFIGIVLLFPLDIAAEYAADSAAAAAAEKNIWLSYGEIEAEGILNKNIICKKISVDTAVLSLRASDIRTDLMVFASLLSLSKTAGIFIGKGDVAVITGQRLKWNSASAKIRVKGDSLSLSDIAMTGDIIARGHAYISRSTGKISRADVTVRFSPELDPFAVMLSGMNILPMTRIASGEWRITK